MRVTISPEKLLLNRTSREFFRAIRSHIHKTSSVRNSDSAAISRQDSKLKTNLELNGSHVNDNIWSRHINIRALSTKYIYVKPTAAFTNAFSDEEREEFMAIFPDIVRDLTETDMYPDMSEVKKRFAKVLQYSVPHGKKTRGLSTMLLYKSLEKPENVTPESIRLAGIIGWCIEVMHTFILMEDDIMDNSEIRRGAICWYKNKDVGLQAINDSVLIENSVYRLLKKYFSSHPCYVPIVELFHDLIMKTLMGQSLDMLCKQDDKPRLDLFTMNRFQTISKYKAGYYFSIPIPLTMYLTNTYDEKLHRQTETALVEIVEFLQIQDDFLDCFGDKAVTRKLGFDIKEGKGSWLAVVALQRATPAQRKVMEEHYGRPEEESSQIIRNLYEELNLPAVYAKCEEESLSMIHNRAQQLPKGILRDLILSFI